MQTFDNSLSIVTWNINGIRRVFNNKTSTQLPKNKYYSPENNCSMSNLIKQMLILFVYKKQGVMWK